MKTTLFVKPSSPFPKLQKAANGNIFLMSNPNTGTCVYDTSTSLHFLGIHYTDILSENLVDFNDALLLEN